MYEQRNIYEHNDDPVERIMGWNGWKRFALGGFLASRVSRARRRMSWTTVGALLVIFIERSYVPIYSFLHSIIPISAFSSRLVGEGMVIPLPSLRYHSEAQLLFMPRSSSDVIISRSIGPSSKASVKIGYLKDY